MHVNTREGCLGEGKAQIMGEEGSLPIGSGTETEDLKMDWN